MAISNDPSRPHLVWEYDVPVVTHPAMLRTLGTLWIVTAFIMLALVGGIIGVTEGIKAVVPIAGMILLVMTGLAVLTLIVMLLVFGNRIRMAFLIDDRGVVGRIIDTRARTTNRLATVLGALSARPGVAGAGMIAMHDEERTVVWPAIAAVRYDPAHFTITLRNVWRPVLHVFCTRATYKEAAARIAEGVAGVSKKTGSRKNPLWRMLVLTSLVIVATLPLFAMPYPFKAELFAVIFTLCFALATIWLVPLMGWPVLGGVAWIAATIVMRGFATRTNSFTGKVYSGFESLDGGEWVGMVVAFVGLSVLAGLAIAALRGRVQSLLMRDTTEMEGSKP